MTTTLTKNAGIETLEIVYKGTEPKLSNLAMKAAHSLWDEGYGNHGTDEAPIMWEDLLVAQKLELLNKIILRDIKLMAIRYVDTEAVANAQKDVTDTFDDDHEIGD